MSHGSNESSSGWVLTEVTYDHHYRKFIALDCLGGKSLPPTCEPSKHRFELVSVRVEVESDRVMVGTHTEPLRSVGANLNPEQRRIIETCAICSVGRRTVEIRNPGRGNGFEEAESQRAEREAAIAAMMAEVREEHGK